MSKTKDSINQELKTLIEKNLPELPADSVIHDSLFGEKIAEKGAGRTFGKIVKIKKEDGEEFQVLVKKTGREREDEEESTPKTLSREVDKLKSIKESFGEVRAAKLFAALRPDYLSEIWLVTSDYNLEKKYNRNNEGLKKVYVASKIIGDPEMVNNNGFYIARLFGPRSEYKDDLPILTDDLCVNAVLMMVLTSNYDLKRDNFVHDVEKKRMIPIDFGDAGLLERTPDIIGGIDSMRMDEEKRKLKIEQQTDSPSESRKNLLRASSSSSSVDLFADMSLLNELKEGHEATQKFYNKNLQPKHFLEAIKIIKDTPEAKEKIYEIAYNFTFGEEKDKKEQAENTLARVENLLKMEFLFEKIKDDKDFSKKNLREIWAESDEFKKEISTAIEQSPAKVLYKFVDEIFQSIFGYDQALRDLLDKYKTEQSQETANSIHENVEKVNEFLEGTLEELSKKFTELEKYYSDSVYLKNYGESDETQEVDLSSEGSDYEVEVIERKEWQQEKDNILNALKKLIKTLIYPLVEQNRVSEKEIPSQDESELQENFSDNESSNSDDKSEENEEIKKWDLTKCEKYLNALDKVHKNSEESYREITKNIELLLTHLLQHDTLFEVRSRSEIPSALLDSKSAQPVLGSSAKEEKLI